MKIVLSFLLFCANCFAASPTEWLSDGVPINLNAASITPTSGKLWATTGTAFSATSTPTLGASGTLGTLTFGNATSGTILLTPTTGALGTVTLTMPATTGTILVSGGTINATNSVITNDTTTNATMYPVWVTTTSGNLPLKISSTKMTFNPSIGSLQTTLATFTAATVGELQSSGSKFAIQTTGAFFCDNNTVSTDGSGHFTAATATVNGSTPILTTATGETNTGYMRVNGKTSGSVTLTTADSTAFDVTISPIAQTVDNGIVTIPDLGGATAIMTLNDRTQTITNKRNQPRVVSAASYTTDTGTSLTVATTDIFVITAQAGALKFNNPGGTPIQGEKLCVRIKDNGTARALTYDTQFRASSDLALATTTTLSKTLYMLFIYNATDTKWDLMAKLDNF